MSIRPGGTPGGTGGPATDQTARDAAAAAQAKADAALTPAAAAAAYAPIDKPLSGTDALQRRTLVELTSWLDWLDLNGAKGYLGEFGVPGVGTDTAAWNALLNTYYAALDDAGVWASQWSAGRGWGTAYTLGAYVNGSANGDVNTAQTSAAVIESHLESRRRGKRGVALSGFEFPIAGSGGNGVRTGTNFVASQADLTYLASRGVRTVRVGMAWERLQPTLSAALDTTALGNLDLIITRARTAGIKVILDLHNYARYTQADGTTVLIVNTAGSLTDAHLSDFWTRLSAWVRLDVNRNASVVGYGLMNEPHDLASGPFVSGKVVHQFGSTVEGFTGGTRDTTAFPDGGVVFSVPTGGGQFHDNAGWTANAAAPLSQYGTTLRYVFQSPSSMTGFFSVQAQLQRAAGNSTGADYSQAQDGTYYNINTTPTTIDWTPPAGTLDAVRWLGFNAGGSGRSGNQNLFLDRIEVGAGVAPARVWEQVSQSVVTAIRAAGDRRTILVSGYNYSHTHEWATTHPQAWVVDPVDNTRYESHHYWDTTSTVGARTGTYANGGATLPYATELAAAVSGGF